jgi:hypothetical protein
MFNPSWLSEEVKQHNELLQQQQQQQQQQQPQQQQSNINNTGRNLNEFSSAPLSSNYQYGYNDNPSSANPLIALEQGHLYRGLRSDAAPTQLDSSPSSLFSNILPLSQLSLKEQHQIQTKPQQSAEKSANWLPQGLDLKPSNTAPVPFSAAPVPVSVQISLPTPPPFVEFNSSFYSEASYTDLINSLSNLFHSPAFSVDFTYESSKHRFKCVTYDNCQSVVFNIYFYSAENNLILVEFQRRSGHCTVFYSFYARLVNKLRPLNLVSDKKEPNLPRVCLSPIVSSTTPSNLPFGLEPPELLGANDQHSITADSNLFDLLFSMLSSTYLESKRNALDGFSAVLSCEANAKKCLNAPNGDILAILGQLLDSGDLDISRNAAQLLDVLGQHCARLNLSNSLFIPAASRCGLLVKSIDLIDAPNVEDSSCGVLFADGPLFQRATKRLLCDLVKNLSASIESAQAMRESLTQSPANDHLNAPLWDTLLNLLDRYSHSADEALSNNCKLAARNLDLTKP